MLRQPAALHLHMATLARAVPGLADGHRRLRAPGPLRRRAATATSGPPTRRPRAARKRPRYDAALAAWQDVLAGQELLVVTATRENDVRRALALADEFKVKVAVAGAPQASRVADLVKSRKLPLLVSVNFDPPRAAAFFGGADDDKERRDIEEAERNPAELHKAGVAFALVSAYAPDFLAGVRKAIERGLPAGGRPARGHARGRRRCWAWPTGWAAWTRARSRTWWCGRASRWPRTRRPRMVFVDGALYEPDEAPRRRPRAPQPSPSPAAEDLR